MQYGAAMKKKIILILVIGFLFVFQSLSAQNWYPTKRLSWTSSSSFSPVVATDSGNNIHIVWSDYLGSIPEILYKKSTDGGSTWSTERLTWNSGHSTYPDIAIDSNNRIHVVWRDSTPGNSELFYKKSTDGGVSWTTKRLTWTSGNSEDPAIATDSSNNIHIFWQDDRNVKEEIFYQKSTDGGSTWTAKRLTWDSGASRDPAVAIDTNDNIHIAWRDSKPGSLEIYYKKSTNGGASWTTKRLTWNSEGFRYPDIATDSGNNVFVVWSKYQTGDYEIFLKKSTDGGTTWSKTRLTRTSGDSDHPAIAIDPSDNIHVVWDDGTVVNEEIYYKRSTDGGTTWTTKRLTWLLYTSWYPALSIDPISNIHVVWSERYPGNYEIYYRKGQQ
jgi:hypothetical protein